MQHICFDAIIVAIGLNPDFLYQIYGRFAPINAIKCFRPYMTT